MSEAALGGMHDARVARRRRRRRVALAVLLLWGLTFLMFGCTSTVYPPKAPEDPVEVFLLGDAMHTGVVLPPDPLASGNPDQYVEFGFGDWGWYALGQDSWYHSFATMLWPTQATLSRRTFGASTAKELRQRAFWTELSVVLVDRQRANELRSSLQKQFDAARKHVVVNPSYGMKFVPIERSYWLPNNCADIAAQWFEALGCEVGWCPLRFSLAVAVP